MCDASCKGNPGESKAGIVVWKKIPNRRKTTPDYQQSYPLGILTNNQAEWMAVIKAIDYAKMMKEKELYIYSDSKLVVNQAMGNWKIKDFKMQDLFQNFITKTKNMQVVLTWLPRQLTVLADNLT
jgi:ribonuclease HI